MNYLKVMDFIADSGKQFINLNWHCYEQKTTFNSSYCNPGDSLT